MLFLLTTGCARWAADPATSVDTPLFDGQVYGDSAALDTAETAESPTDTAETGDEPVDADGDGSPADEDCDDADPSRHPLAVEHCDGVDQDCDDVADDACTTSPAGSLTTDDATVRIEGPCLESGFGQEFVAVTVEVGPPWLIETVGCEDATRLVGFAGPFRPDEMTAEIAGTVLSVAAPGADDALSARRGVELDGDPWSELLVRAELGPPTTRTMLMLFADPTWDMTTDDADLSVIFENPIHPDYGRNFHGAAIPGSVAALVATGSWMLDYDYATAEAWIASAEETGEVSTLDIDTLGPEARTAWYEVAPAPYDAGDLNGDGENELLIAYNELADVYLGPVLPATGGRLPDVRLAGRYMSDPDYFGRKYAWSHAGDLDGDGHDELLVASTLGDDPPNEQAGVFAVNAETTTLDSLAPLLLAANDEDYYGREIATLDADGDGYLDIAASAMLADGAAENTGTVFLEYGPFVGTRELGVSRGAAISGVEESAYLGKSIAGFDSNGDGFDDLAVGTELGSTADHPGTIWIFLGGQ